MSTFSASFNKKFNLKDKFNILQNIDLKIFPYICLYDFDNNNVVFKQRYDCIWFIQNEMSTCIKPESTSPGLLGYIYVSSSSYVMFFVDFFRCVVEVSTIKSMKFQTAQDNVLLCEAYYSDILIQDITSILNKNLSELLRCDTPLIFTKENIVITKEYEFINNSVSISKQQTLSFKDDRISLSKKIIQHNLLIFSIYNPRKEYKFKAITGFTEERKYRVCIISSDKIKEMPTVDKDLEELCQYLCSIVETVSGQTFKKHEDDDLLKDLIGNDPRIFYSGIARHCPVKPTPIKDYGSETNNNFQVLYPKNNPTLYVARKGYFISLKINKVPIPADHKYNKYPVFPCCIKTLDSRVKNIYETYLNSKDDEEFESKVKHLVCHSKSPTLLPIDYTGSLYSPINKILDPSILIRKRVVDWYCQFKIHLNTFSSEEWKLCVEKFNDLGYRDDSTLSEYINLPDHDIRITCHIYERLLNATFRIFVKHNLSVREFVHATDQRIVDNERTIHIIIYLRDSTQIIKKGGRVEGYEIITTNNNESSC